MLALTQCRFDRLINPRIADRIIVSPDSLRDSAHSRSNVAETVTLRIASADGATLRWNAASTAAWLSLTPSTGGAPDSLVVALSPNALSQALYQDTIVFTSPEAPNDTTRVPVSFDVL